MPQTILVVDDAVDTRELLHLYLTREGFTVIIAADGGEGLYRARADRPDLIITDITMPNLDGISMIGQLRGEPETAGIPIIALTGYGKEHLEEALAAGATRAKEKPFDFEELIAQVRSLLGQS
jgi:CheY-like chemotaxis protein